MLATGPHIGTHGVGIALGLVVTASIDIERETSHKRSKMNLRIVYIESSVLLSCRQTWTFSGYIQRHTSRLT